MEGSSEQPDAVVDLTSPLSSVDASTRDRSMVQEELEKRLKCRPERDNLVEKNILLGYQTAPKLFTQTQQLHRAQVADSLQKALRNRADRNELLQMNILPNIHTKIDPALHTKRMQLIKSQLADTLNEKLAKRPGPLDLLKERILEPSNEQLAEVVSSLKGLEDASQPTGTPEVALQTATEGKHGKASKSTTLPMQRHSIAGTVPSRSQLRFDYSPPKDLTSPPSVGLSSHRKFSDSSISPANSPGDLDDDRLSVKSPANVTSPLGLTSSYPPSVRTPGIMSTLGKAPSPSQTRKKQQKQQKYRKLRYHEYVPPSKSNAKGGKTTPKPSKKPDTPYSLLLQQQQLFLQLQVLQQQYPNGTLMQKLPDLISMVSKDKSGKASTTGSSNGASSGAERAQSLPISNIPQVLKVEQPNKFNIGSVRFDELKVNDLKGACKELGMIVSGKKAELVDRLLEHNKGLLPAVALPENPSKDSRRQTFSASHTSSVESQISVPSTVSPLSPGLSPIFRFPGDLQNGVPSRQAHASKQDSMPNLLPEVFPASSLQNEINEMFERQKREYISQKGCKSLAPRPELQDMVAIKLPAYPMEQAHKSRGSTLPHRSDSKPPWSDKSSRSLPSSPQPLSPNELISEFMEGTESHETSSRTQASDMSRQRTVNSAKHGFNQPTSTLYQFASTASMHTVNSSPALVASAVASTQMLPPQYQSHSFFTAPAMRPNRSSVPVQSLHAKVHPLNPPSYGSPMMQRSLSVSGAAPPISVAMSSAPRLHNGSSFNSDLSTSEMGKSTAPDNLLLPDQTISGQDFMDMQMDTGDHPLSEIFDILREDGAEFSLPVHQSLPMSASHGSTSPVKNTGPVRQGSAQSDSIMLAGGAALPFGNPQLASEHKAGSDICLNVPPARDGQKNSTGSYGNPGNVMANNDLGWLDLDNNSGLSLSPTMNMFGALNQSNPGSLHHDQYHMDFMNDSHLNSSNSALNRLSSHPLDMNNYFEPGISHNSGMFATSEESTLLELGLSTS